MTEGKLNIAKTEKGSSTKEELLRLREAWAWTAAEGRVEPQPAATTFPATPGSENDASHATE